ncbi:hypothetical protein niasHT_002055 [Heterodera trifolii]|uniref:Uncharacterized protein n=1 Tax=Heterodera trifolii TaxID=157864 RepID=A0ABD2M410_9BILA
MGWQSICPCAIDRLFLFTECFVGFDFVSSSSFRARCSKSTASPSPCNLFMPPQATEVAAALCSVEMSGKCSLEFSPRRPNPPAMPNSIGWTGKSVPPLREFKRIRFKLPTSPFVNAKLSDFQRLIVLQCPFFSFPFSWIKFGHPTAQMPFSAIRPDRLRAAMFRFTSKLLGIDSLSSATLDFASVHQRESVPHQLNSQFCLLLIAPGSSADPSAELTEYAQREFAKNASGQQLHQLAMGESHAEWDTVELLRHSALEGHWLCLYNMHLTPPSSTGEAKGGEAGEGRSGESQNGQSHQLLLSPVNLDQLFRPVSLLNAFRQFSARELGLSLDELVLNTHWHGFGQTAANGTAAPKLTLSFLRIQGALFEGAELRPVPPSAAPFSPVPQLDNSWTKLISKLTQCNGGQRRAAKLAHGRTRRRALTEPPRRMKQRQVMSSRPAQSRRRNDEKKE